MKPFATLPAAERALIINEAAGRLGLVPLIVEKDFWVCWTLARIFEVEAVAAHVVFKGGTSLSKVFGAIQRFSEDIDLAVSPQALGFAAAELDEAPSANQRRKRVQALEAECERCVAERFRPALEAAIAARLGTPQHADGWLRYEIDALAGTPNLLFTYPTALAQAGGYIAKQVKLEFGALTAPTTICERTWWRWRSRAPSGRRRRSCTLSTIGRLNYRSVTDSRATTRTSRRCGGTRAVPQLWRGWICSKTWSVTRRASSRQRGPTTKPPGRGRSDSCRHRRAMLHWRGTMRRWRRCLSACRSGSMSCCSAFRVRSNSSTMEAYLVPLDPHMMGVSLGVVSELWRKISNIIKVKQL
jgi:Nucleotidyl transferase AbiEii toxin, Type IV TA system